jgi:2'-5' RNA ligase
MRLFVAIELDEKFRRRLIDLQDSLRVVVPEVSFTKPDNLHLTLKFIGEFQDAKVPALCEILKGVQKPGKFELKFTGLDLLPERGPIRIVAAAVDGGEKLLALQAAIEEACATQNIPKENRRYRPHITLARARRPLQRSSKSRLFHAITTDEPVAMPVREFVLMQSSISNKGSVYTPLQHLIL